MEIDHARSLGGRADQSDTKPRYLPLLYCMIRTEPRTSPPVHQSTACLTSMSLFIFNSEPPLGFGKEPTSNSGTEPPASQSRSASSIEPSKFSFASPQIALLVGLDKIRFTAHQDRLLQWPYFRAALSGAFAEAENQCINLPADRPAVVQAFLEFIYSGNYVYQPPQDQPALKCIKSGDDLTSTDMVCPCKNFVICGTPPMKHTEPNFNQCLVCDHTLEDHQVKKIKKVSAKSAPSRSASETALARMEFHAQLYFLADRFGISKLQKLAADRVYEPGPAPDAESTNDLKVARLIYANTPTSDKLLRRMALEKTVDLLLTMNSITPSIPQSAFGYQSVQSVAPRDPEVNGLLEELVTQDTSFAVDIIKCMAINGQPARKYH